MFLYNMKRGACESTPFYYIYKVFFEKPVTI